MYIPPAVCEIQTLQRFVFLTQDSETRRPQSVSDCKQHSTSLVATVDIKLKKFRLARKEMCVYIHACMNMSLPVNVRDQPQGSPSIILHPFPFRTIPSLNLICLD